MVATYQGGHLTQKDFAAKIGVVPATLAAWVRRAAAAKAASSDAFVSVPNLFPAAAAGTAYRMVFPKGVTVEVGSGFSPAEIETLLRLVRDL